MVDSLRDFLKTPDQASKCLQTPLLKPKTEIEATKSNNKLFTQYYINVAEHPNKQVCFSFRLKNYKSCSF